MGLENVNLGSEQNNRYSYRTIGCQWSLVCKNKKSFCLSQMYYPWTWQSEMPLYIVSYRFFDPWYLNRWLKKKSIRAQNSDTKVHFCTKICFLRTTLKHKVLLNIPSKNNSFTFKSEARAVPLQILSVVNFSQILLLAVYCWISSAFSFAVIIILRNPQFDPSDDCCMLIGTGNQGQDLG